MLLMLADVEHLVIATLEADHLNGESPVGCTHNQSGHCELRSGCGTVDSGFVGNNLIVSREIVPCKDIVGSTDLVGSGSDVDISELHELVEISLGDCLHIFGHYQLVDNLRHAWFGCLLIFLVCVEEVFGTCCVEHPVAVGIGSNASHKLPYCITLSNTVVYPMRSIVVVCVCDMEYIIDCDIVDFSCRGFKPSAVSLYKDVIVAALHVGTGRFLRVGVKAV